jgi:NAD(P)-dependent dehydrogenase (short-subunit alcohol dehydrogenase family)
VAGAFAAIPAEFGVPDIVINNAGTTHAAMALDQTEADWDRVVDTNLKGAFLVAQEAARRLIAANKPGSIINIASVLGLRQAATVAPYAASKAGLIQLTRELALEWARYGIRVNAIAPGYFLSALNRDYFTTAAGEALVKRVPQRRLGEPADLDGALLLLASDASRFMTGAVLSVDGGHSVSTL